MHKAAQWEDLVRLTRAGPRQRPELRCERWVLRLWRGETRPCTRPAPTPTDMSFQNPTHSDNANHQFFTALENLKTLNISILVSETKTELSY